jgi:hypothetical protein
MNRQQILAEIRQTAADNGGVPLGKTRFAQVTGIRETDWSGRFWARWSDALREAGFEPNEMQARFDDEGILEALASEVRRLGRWPTTAELRLRRRADPAFPSHGTFARLGGRRDLAARMVAYCQQRDDMADVEVIAASVTGMQQVAVEEEDPASSPVVLGYVYMLRVGRNYKIGRSNAFGRRHRELAIQLPDQAETVHVIRTDDPVGIEAYWHGRFADRRKNGEWFALSAADVKAFKRRKFM